METIIEVKNLTINYPGFSVKNVNFEIKKGSIVGFVGFVGENGAGKTSTILAMLNLIPNYQGDISIFSLDNRKDEKEIKEKTGVVLDDAFFYKNFNMSEISLTLKNIYKNWDSAYFEKLLGNASIPMDKKFEECSKGMQAKVKIFSSLAHHPKLLLLDEPTTGLDPVSRDELLDLFYEFIDEESAIFFSSHITTDIEKISDAVIFIHDGDIALITEQADFQENYGILRVTSEQAQELSQLDYLFCLKNSYNTELLINNRSFIKKEFPDLVVDKATIDEALILIKKGERK